MKNKNILYIGLALVLGLVIGYFIFYPDPSTINNKEAVDLDKQEWTCSMHPEVIRSNSGDCPICGMDLIPLVINTNNLSPDQFRMTENAIALANIETTIVSNKGKTGGGIKVSGKIREREENNTIQSSYFTGRIEKLNVTYAGQEVKKGQRLAMLYSPDLITAQKEFLTASDLKESQPELYNAVYNKLKLLKLSDKQIKAIESLGSIIENFPIYANVSGVVSEVLSTEGAYIKEGEAILRVSNLSSVWAEFDVYENQIGVFKEGQQIKIEVPSSPEKNFDAIISFIDPILDMQKRTFVIRATLDNPDKFFKPGMFVNGQVFDEFQNDQKYISVPSSAVLWTGKRSIIYIKTDGPVFEMREVVLGDKNDETYRIIEGLSLGEEIVTNGAFTVDAAAQLQGKKSMMKR
ncbi:efflux RND transporter periplasmic adaptor subunit [Aquimarina pacifica]|uniref:efflux RND transporter periplasmic adaptor subunit n=1 Tax=Aquimarina pacifica TaxID=1296415 RepID=UPI0004AC782F|nr:efflux RND transporter periplasmic adaptor subunit [Aquimarina pacifica]